MKTTLTTCEYRRASQWAQKREAHMLRKVISGGQQGVDIAALRAAKAVGFQTGGWMPFGFRTEDGNRPEYWGMYGLLQLGTRGYNGRTEKNIRESDATLIIGTDLNSSGSRLTRLLCKAANHPVLTVDLSAWKDDGPDGILQALRYPENVFTRTTVLALSTRGLCTLNVAGNRHSWLEAPVEAWLREVFAEVLRRQSAPTPPPAQEGE